MISFWIEDLLASLYTPNLLQTLANQLYKRRLNNHGSAAM
jgi:hypothetical protein